jgi:hypothetical protein
MTLEIIRPRTVSNHTCHHLCFYCHGEMGGYGFDCDEHGNVDISDMSATARASYQHCLDDERDGGLLYRKFIETYHSREVDPAVARCRCGEEIALTSWTNECDRCGLLCNNFAQELAPRHCWGEETHEHPSDIERPGDPFSD